MLAGAYFLTAGGAGVAGFLFRKFFICVFAGVPYDLIYFFKEFFVFSWYK